MKYHIHAALNTVGDNSNVNQIKSLTGGEINQVFYCETELQSYIIKLNNNVTDDFFDLERDALKELSEVGKVNVPKVFGVYQEKGNPMQGLIMEWIAGNQHDKTIDLLGEAVGRLHNTKGSHYGYKRNTYIGEMVQENGWHTNWAEYFSGVRLKSQLEVSVKKGLMGSDRQKGIEYIIEHVDAWIPKHVFPSLLHGDLWSGNWLPNRKGEPCFIDPSIFYGHSEMELAYTELFGRFPQRFYDIYYDLMKPEPEYENRKLVYQLFYLIVHLNVFGEKYGPHIDRVLSKYVPVGR